MTTTITNAMIPVPVMPMTITYSSTVDLYDIKSFEKKTKKGKYWWHLTAKTEEGCKNDGISAKFKHADKILDLFKYCSVQFGLDNIMNILMFRKGAVHATPQTIVGMDHWNADLRDYINILMSYRQLSLYQVCAFSSWFMGNKTSSLTKSYDTKINDIDPNEAGKFGLAN